MPSISISRSLAIRLSLVSVIAVLGAALAIGAMGNAGAPHGKGTASTFSVSPQGAVGVEKRALDIVGVRVSDDGSLTIEGRRGNSVIGAASRRELPKASIQGLLNANGAANGFYACVAESGAIYGPYSIPIDDCEALDAENGETL